MEPGPDGYGLFPLPVKYLRIWLKVLK
jgi:hypothetical protein